MRRSERSMRAAILCRWALLASLAGIALWACVVAGVSVEREPPAVLSVSDSVYGAGRWIIVAAWGSSAAAGAKEPRAMAILPGEPAIIMSPSRNSDILYVPPSKTDSDFVVAVEGIPYGPLAFARGSARVLSVRPDRYVYVVEASLIDEALQADSGGVGEFFGELLRRGLVVCSDNGELSRFHNLQEQLRRLAPDVLAVHTPDIDPLQLAVSTIGRGGGKNTFLITARPAQAGAAAVQGFVVYLVNPGATDTGNPRLLTYPSLQALTRHFHDDRVQIESLRRQAVQDPSDATSVP